MKIEHRQRDQQAESAHPFQKLLLSPFPTWLSFLNFLPNLLAMGTTDKRIEFLTGIGIYGRFEITAAASAF